MLDRRTQIGGFYAGHISIDRVEVFDGQHEWHDRRRGIVRERRCNVFDLGEGRVRVERVEGLKPDVPVVECFQQREGRGGADGLHPVRCIDDMAPTTVQKRELFAGESIAFEDGFGLNDFLFAESGKS